MRTLELVDMPRQILSEWEKGRNSHAGLTDLLRLGLLANYGEAWADYAILFPGPVSIATLPNLLTCKNFDLGEAGVWFCASDLMRSMPGNELMQLTFSSLSRQWEQIGQTDYFDCFWHLAEAARRLGPGVLENRIFGSPKSVQSLMAALHRGSLESASSLRSAGVLHKLSLKTSLDPVELIRWMNL